MPTSVLSGGVLRASFQASDGSSEAIEFDAQLVEWTDVRKQRVVLHQYLKRDGGEAELMGREPFRVRFNIVYVGPNWRNNYLKLISVIDANPLGVLVHPMFGKMQAFCEGIDGSKVDSANALDTVLVPISFVESNINSANVTQEGAYEGSNAHLQKIQVQFGILSQLTNIYLTAYAAVVLTFNSAVAYGQAAINTVTDTSSLLPGSAPDPTLPIKLGQVMTNAANARTAIRNDPAFVNDASDFPAIAALELLVAECNAMDESLRRVKPQQVQYVVPVQTSLLAIAQRFYGKNAVGRLDEIRASNVGKIPNPAAIAAGTVLAMSPPTTGAF